MKKYEISKKVGQTIRKERENRGYSQEAFADKCGLHRTYMSSVERGERNITIGSICVIAEGLEISASELLKRAGL